MGMNLPGFHTVKNWSPKPVEFMWDGRPYVLDAGESYNLPDHLCRAAMKASVYRIDDNNVWHCYVLPEGVEPVEPFPDPNDPVDSYVFNLDKDAGYGFITLPVEGVKHRRISGDNVFAHGVTTGA